MLNPSFFDIFGVMGFLYIFTLSLWGLAGKNLPRWSLGILLLIGSIGLLVDGLIVYLFYLK